VEPEPEEEEVEFEEEEPEVEFDVEEPEVEFDVEEPEVESEVEEPAIAGPRVMPSPRDIEIEDIDLDEISDEEDEEDEEDDLSEKEFGAEEVKGMSDSKLKQLIDKVYKQQEGLEQTTREQRVKLLRAKRCHPDPKKNMVCPDDLLCDARNYRCVPQLKKLPPGVNMIEINNQKVIGSNRAIEELEKLLKQRPDVRVEEVSFEDEAGRPGPAPRDVEIDFEEIAFEEEPVPKDEDEKDIEEVLKEVQEENVKNLDKVRLNILKCLGLVTK